MTEHPRHSELPGNPVDRRFTLDRRRLLLGGLAGAGAIALSGVALAGCGSDTPPTAVDTNHNPKYALLAAFPQMVPHIPPNVPFRLPYLVSDSEGIPLTKIPGPVTFTVTNSDGDKVGDPVAVTPRGDGVPRAYLPLTITFPSVGVYTVTAEVNGTKIDSALQVYDKSRVTPPVVGDQLPPVDTPTVQRSLQVTPICTAVPQCAFHQVSLQDALGKGKPVVVLLSTPAYCQTAVCGPVLDLLTAETGGRTDITVIHSEVYKNPKEFADNLAKAPLAPLPDAYQMSFEPSLFITDASGVLRARADAIVDRSEMAELLTLAR